MRLGLGVLFLFIPNTLVRIARFLFESRDAPSLLLPNGDNMYGKIFDTIYNGTLYGHWEALVTMQQFIVLADADGVVDMTPMAISARTSIPREIIDKGIKILEAPDKFTRTPGSDGRRLELIDEHRPWGWVLVNYEHYKSLRDSDTVRAQTKERVRKHRAKKKDVTLGNAPKRHIDIDIDIDKPYRATKRVPQRWDLSDHGGQFATESGMDAETTSCELAAFRDHEFKTARKDWDACWRTWCRNWKKWSKDETRKRPNEFEVIHAKNRKAAGLD